MSDGVGHLLFGTFAATWLLYHRHSSVVTVHSIMIYPIKSCKGISVSSWYCDTSGLLFDRVYMLADKSLNYKFISQRKYPLMALITPEIDTNSGNLMVNAPGMNTLMIKLPGKLEKNDEVVNNTSDAEEGKVIQCDIWGDVCDAVEMSESISLWFSEYLKNDGIKCIRMAPSFHRKLDPKYDRHDNHTVFSDGFPYLLTSTASIADLQSRMPSSIAISTENFRPNIVVTGCEAYAEDNWSKITIKTEDDSIHLEVVKPCARCKIPSIDTVTGIMDPANTVTKVMRTYRTGKHLGYSNSKWLGEVFFGQNVVASNDCKNYMKKLSVGDVLYVT